MKTVIMAALATLLITGTADAKPKNRNTQATATFDQAAQPAYPIETTRTVSRGGLVVQYEGSVVGGRPAGCPHRYCGCAVSLKVFGRIITDLNLAANWRKFASAPPSSGMVAWRNGHVIYIETVNGDGTVVAYDPNSGGHKTRVHTVSLRKYHVVNPHTLRYASR